MSTKRSLLLAAFAGGIVGGIIGLLIFAAERAFAATYPCFGAPADYQAAFNIDYPEPRVFLEVQGWLTKPGQTPGQHSEHIHSGTCFPQGETWNPSVLSGRLDYRHVFHNVIGYKVTQVRGGFVDAGVNINATSGQLAELNMAANSSAGTTKTVFQSYALNFAAAKSNGRKELRTGLKVIRSTSAALVNEWFTSTGWMSYFNFPGKPFASPNRPNDGILCRNWATGFDYGNNGFGHPWKASSMALAVPEPWSVLSGMASGVNRGSFHIDPDFHTGNQGIWSLSFTGEAKRSIPTNTFPSGMHRLVYLGHEGGSGITSSVVCSMPFRVGA